MRSMAYFRSLVISLALSLTIVDLTQGFTLRYQLPQDLVAEESSHLEVKHDLKRSNDNQTANNEDTVANLPIQTNHTKPETTTNATENAESVKKSTHNTSVDNMQKEVTELLTSTEVMTTATAADVKSTDSLETTTAYEIEKNDEPSYNTNNTATLNVTKSLEFDNTVLPIDLNANGTSIDFSLKREMITTDIPEQTTAVQLQTSTSNANEDKTTVPDIESTILDTTTESQSTETSMPFTSFKMIPGWKKYATISRNRVDNTEKEDHTPPTVKFVDSVNSHTTESRITLEKAFALSPDIESLQVLKVNLMESSNAITQRTVETNAAETRTEVFPAATIGIQDNMSDDTKTSVIANQTEMVSKMAGFLNHSNMNSTETSIKTTPNNSRKSDMQLDGVSYEIDYGEHKKSSHSQLADAIKESLLEESVLHDREVNSIRYRLPNTEKEHSSLGVITLKTADVQPVTEAVQNEEKAIDALTVKPISHEKKNTNIYAVNPNYKPLKKIDVQPMKPFTRDPDDNSWRNESLTSLGIVFKAKNASKAFTEVLKNKTETVMNSLPEVDKTVEKYELRDRLEKIAEKRKSKKKKVDKFGNTEYTDYEENNNSGDSPMSKETPPSSSPLPITEVISTESTTMPVPVPLVTTNTKPRPQVNTEKPKKPLPDYYDSSDDDDYPTLPNVDIMKATIRPRVQWPVTQRILEESTSKQYLPERKPTVQYFPPLRKETPDLNRYDDDLQKKNPYKPAESIESTGSPSGRNRNYPTESNYRSGYNSNENRIHHPIEDVQFTPEHQASLYLTVPPKSPASFEGPDGYNRGFLVRQFKDLIDSAIKDSDYDRNAYLFTERPVNGVTADAGKMTVKSEEYDYERKEVLDKFVNNFNQNHEQFKVDFPVLFNSSVVHKQGQEGGKVLASSSSTFKRLYNDDTATKVNGFLFSSKPYDPSCENITVELSPAYELHYYVPDQEEREESKTTVPYGFRL